MTISHFPALHLPLSPGGRRLAYSAVGDAHSHHVLVCLPGLLETRATFDPLLKAAQTVPGLRVISLDHCGRGDSDPLPHDAGYAMSVYLQDTAQLLREVVMQDGHPLPHIEVLGTSMGGILAMYLAQDAKLHIQGVFLNDIGLSLNWMAIMGLYGSMKQDGRMPTPQALSQQLHVRIGAVEAVQSSTHFDLPYKKDWKGMRFAHLLKGFKGPVRLIYGGDSPVCTQEQLSEIQRELPGSALCLVPGSGHPAPYNDEVCKFVLAQMQPAPLVHPHPADFKQQELWTQTTSPGQNQGFWPWLKRRYLGAKGK